MFGSNDGDKYRYTVLDGHDDIIDEQGNTTLRLRKLYWGDRENNVKLDFRRWMINANGDEVIGKGTSFLTEDGPSTFVELLTEKGYGDTKKVLNNLKDRPDFRSSLNKVLGEDDDLYDSTIEDTDDSSLYDPKQCLF